MTTYSGFLECYYITNRLYWVRVVVLLCVGVYSGVVVPCIEWYS